jgi:hypothetical protein
MGPGGSENYPSRIVLCSLFRMSLANLITPFLADWHEHRKLLRHIAIGKQILHFLRQPHHEGIS